MKKVILLSCVSKKANEKAKAKEFCTLVHYLKKSLAYAYKTLSLMRYIFYRQSIIYLS